MSRFAASTYYGVLKRTSFNQLDLVLLAGTLLPTDTIQEIHYFKARVSSRPYSPVGDVARRAVILYLLSRMKPCGRVSGRGFYDSRKRPEEG